MLALAVSVIYLFVATGVERSVLPQWQFAAFNWMGSALAFTWVTAAIPLWWASARHFVSQRTWPSTGSQIFWGFLVFGVPGFGVYAYYYFHIERARRDRPVDRWGRSPFRSGGER